MNKTRNDVHKITMIIRKMDEELKSMVNRHRYEFTKFSEVFIIEYDENITTYVEHKLYRTS